MEKACIFFTDGFEEIEALAVVDLLRRANIDTDMVSITGRLDVTGSHGISVHMDQLFENVDFDSVTLFLLPGGPGTKDLEAHEGLMEKLDAFYKAGKTIGAICAAPSILGHKGMLKGRRACAYPGYESQLEGAYVSYHKTETDGNIITARGMGCAIDFGLAIIEKVQGEEAAKELAQAIVYSCD
ncbi:DJ-1 family glyoxalase III [Kineothrix sp. MB12-C1]|uniref:DJ-1 family glyoxalase III n=1 Tax=Kineothrix sp. MB12-C1 TaxID=3070215 RepID=UPI0027D30F6B|nr:DJ-1 family glyoxalase III [Kineothrix sp. MB12-C1]WMC93607.1 DJ-1/PfpI family protein [Kineothrix sp. MB12-C1]